MIGFISRNSPLLVVCILILFAFSAEARDSPGAFFPDQGISQIQISPGGDWLIATSFKGETRGLLAQRIGEGGISLVFTTRDGIPRVDWVGKDTLLIHILNRKNQIRLLRVDLSYSSLEKKIQHQERWLGQPIFKSVPNWIVDPLPTVEGVVIWEFEHRGVNSIHRVKLSELRDFLRRHPSRVSRVKVGTTLSAIEGSSHKWVVDRKGVPIAAYPRDKDGYSILVRKPRNGPLGPTCRNEEGSMDSAAER